MSAQSTYSLKICHITIAGSANNSRHWMVVWLAGLEALSLRAGGPVGATLLLHLGCLGQITCGAFCVIVLIHVHTRARTVTGAPENPKIAWN